MSRVPGTVSRSVPLRDIAADPLPRVREPQAIFDKRQIDGTTETSRVARQAVCRAQARDAAQSHSEELGREIIRNLFVEQISLARLAAHEQIKPQLGAGDEQGTYGQLALVSALEADLARRATAFILEDEMGTDGPESEVEGDGSEEELEESTDGNEPQGSDLDEDTDTEDTGAADSEAAVDREEATHSDDVPITEARFLSVRHRNRGPRIGPPPLGVSLTDLGPKHYDIEDHGIAALREQDNEIQRMLSGRVSGVTGPRRRPSRGLAASISRWAMIAVFVVAEAALNQTFLMNLFGTFGKEEAYGVAIVIALILTIALYLPAKSFGYQVQNLARRQGGYLRMTVLAIAVILAFASVVMFSVARYWIDDQTLLEGGGASTQSLKLGQSSTSGLAADVPETSGASDSKAMFMAILPAPVMLLALFLGFLVEFRIAAAHGWNQQRYQDLADREYYDLLESTRGHLAALRREAIARRDNSLAVIGEIASLEHTFLISLLASALADYHAALSYSGSSHRPVRVTDFELPNERAFVEGVMRPYGYKSAIRDYLDRTASQLANDHDVDTGGPIGSGGQNHDNGGGATGHKTRWPAGGSGSPRDHDISEEEEVLRRAAMGRARGLSQTRQSAEDWAGVGDDDEFMSASVPGAEDVK